MVIFGLSINVFVQISKKDQVTTVNDLIDSSVNNVLKLNEKVEEFRNKSMLSFKVKAYSFESLMYEPIACENVDLSVFYNVPTTKENSRIPVTTLCKEVNGALNYTIELKHTPGEQELFLENSQYISIDVNYTGTDFINQGTKLYFLYSG